MESAHLTDQWVRYMGPVYTVLQLQLVMRLDVQQKMLVETYTGDQMCTVSTLQGTAAVDVLEQEGKHEHRKNNSNIPLLKEMKGTQTTLGIAKSTTHPGRQPVLGSVKCFFDQWLIVRALS